MTAAATTIHPFERAGLGKAPFRFVGLSENMWSPAPGVPAKPGGSCDYCGNGIRYEFHVQASDGRKFKVGCDCIRKVEAKGSRLLSDAERKLKAEQKARKNAALAERVNRARTVLADRPELFTDTAHPAIPGKTGRDYAEFLLSHGGDAGRTKACKAIEQATA